MTLFCFLLISLFFWVCGIFLFLFTLLAPYNIYSFREVNIYINNKNMRGKGGGFDSKYLLGRECFFGFRSTMKILAPCPKYLCIFVMHQYLAGFFNKVHAIRRKFFLNLFKSE